MAFLASTDITARTQTCPINYHAREYPERTALITSNRAWTYQELDSLVQVAERSILGLFPNREPESRTRLGIEVVNTADHFAALIACLRLGLEVTLLNPADSDTIKAVKHSIADLSQDLMLDPSTLVLGDSLPETIQRAEWPLDDASSILFTSGSTGTPKAITHRLSSHWFSAIGSSRNIPIQDGDKWLLALPCYHMGGLSILFRAFIAGATVVVAEGKNLAAEIEEHQVTHCSLVSTQLGKLIQEPQNVNSLKHVLIGGSSVPRRLVESAIEKGLPIHLSYGSTEMASQISCTKTLNKLDKLDELGSGRVLPFRSLKLSETGELLVRGECRFHKILGSDELDNKGWHSTGDVGYFNPDGQVVIEGRLDNMFISGGENIHPETIEKALLTLESIDECWVLAVDDEKWGERPIALISPYSEQLAESAKSFAEEHLTKFMRPDSYRPLPALKEGQLKYSRKELTAYSS